MFRHRLMRTASAIDSQRERGSRPTSAHNRQFKKVSQNHQGMVQTSAVRTLAMLFILVWPGMVPVTTSAATGVGKDSSPQAETAAPGVIKSEANLVLVNVIVTDKKRHYIKDLNQKEVHVFEDNAEQPVTNFSRQADMQPGDPDRLRYMVLFFDNSTLSPAIQMLERREAEKFVEATASSNRIMAILDFGRDLHLDQNFTASGDRLKDSLERVKFETFQVARSRQTAQQEENDIVLGNLLRALRDVAGMLGRASGRKTMILFSAGFTPTSLRMADFQYTIDGLNKANVGVYPIDASGMGSLNSTNQILDTMAARTGGVPLVNSNDLLGGMEMVSGEMEESYMIGYAPPNPAHDGRYHKIHVTVDRGGMEVRARNGYFDSVGPDLLAGKPEGNMLEERAMSSAAGEIPITLRVPYFYLKPGIARVNLTLSLPGAAIEFEKQKDKFHSLLNVLGIAYRNDGSVAARFSDEVNLDYSKDERKEIAASSYDYQNSFKIAPGEYTLKVVLSAGSGKFGKSVVPLLVDPFSDQQFTVFGPAFGEKVLPSLLGSADIDPGLSGGSAPLVSNGMQVVPSSNNRFKTDARAFVYMEVYDPPLATSNLHMGIQFNIVNGKTHQTVYSSDTIPIDQYVHRGDPKVPVIFQLPLGKLPVGEYQMEFKGRDSAGNASPVRTGGFSVE